MKEKETIGKLDDLKGVGNISKIKELRNYISRNKYDYLLESLKRYGRNKGRQDYK